MDYIFLFFSTSFFFFFFLQLSNVLLLWVLFLYLWLERPTFATSTMFAIKTVKYLIWVARLIVFIYVGHFSWVIYFGYTRRRGYLISVFLSKIWLCILPRRTTVSWSQKYHYFTYLWVLHNSVSWWFFTEIWVTASLLKSPEFFLVFWLISTMVLFPRPPVSVLILWWQYRAHQLQLVSPSLSYTYSVWTP